jgi:hypothetical protein
MQVLVIRRTVSLYIFNQTVAACMATLLLVLVNAQLCRPYVYSLIKPLFILNVKKTFNLFVNCYYDMYYCSCTYCTFCYHLASY